jgi:hypothetical protein
LPIFEPSLSPPWTATKSTDEEESPSEPLYDAIAPAAAAAVRIRSAVASKKAKIALTKLGIRVEHLRSAYRAASFEGKAVGADPSDNTSEPAQSVRYEQTYEPPAKKPAESP